MALYYASTQINPDRVDPRPVDVPGISSVLFGDASDTTLLRIEAEPRAGAVPETLTIYGAGLSDRPSGFMLQSGQPGDAINVYLDGFGRPVEIASSDGLQLWLEYGSSDIIVHYLLQDGTFGAYLMPITSDIREHLDELAALNGRVISAPGSLHLTSAQVGRRAAPSGNHRQMGDSATFERVAAQSSQPETHTVTVRASARVELNVRVVGRTTGEVLEPVRGARFHVRCDGAPCHADSRAYSFDGWERAQWSENHWRGQFDDREWMSRWREWDGTHVVIVVQEVTRTVPLPPVVDAQLLDQCERARTDRDRALLWMTAPIGLGVAILGALYLPPLAAIAPALAAWTAANPATAAALAWAGSFAADFIWDAIARSPEPCHEWARKVMATRAIWSELQQLRTRVTICADHPLFDFRDESCQDLEYSLFADRQLTVVDGRFTFLHGPIEPFFLTFFSFPEETYDCDLLDFYGTSSNDSGSSAGGARFTTSRAQAWPFDTGECQPYYTPVGFFESCPMTPRQDEPPQTADREPGPTASPDDFRWILVDTQINPENAPLAFDLVPGVDSRAGSTSSWEIAETQFSEHRTWRLDGTFTGEVYVDISFSRPPDVLQPGETIQLSATGALAATRMCSPLDLALETSHAVTWFYYGYGDSGSVLESDLFLKVQPCSCNAGDGHCVSESAESLPAIFFTAPTEQYSPEFTLTARLSPLDCPACQVQWTYRAE